MTTLTQRRIETSPRPARRIAGNLNAIISIAYRDFLKLLRDRPRLLSSFIFPLVFIGILGGSMQANFGSALGYDFLVFVFTGILAQTIFQSSTMGVISLLEDRENDFSQEIFVSPISRYSIVFGKILGETLVALPQALAILIFALVLQVPMMPGQVLGLVITGVLIGLYGGAFGIALLGVIPTRRGAEQIFPFILLPQYFTAGIFVPVKVLPPLLDLISRLSPMRYAVDLTRGVFYYGTPEYDLVVLAPPLVNAIILSLSFLLFMLVGTLLFVGAERNR